MSEESHVSSFKKNFCDCDWISLPTIYYVVYFIFLTIHVRECFSSNRVKVTEFGQREAIINHIAPWKRKKREGRWNFQQFPFKKAMPCHAPLRANNEHEIFSSQIKTRRRIGWPLLFLIQNSFKLNLDLFSSICKTLLALHYSPASSIVPCHCCRREFATLSRALGCSCAMPLCSISSLFLLLDWRPSWWVSEWARRVFEEGRTAKTATSSIVHIANATFGSFVRNLNKHKTRHDSFHCSTSILSDVLTLKKRQKRWLLKRENECFFNLLCIYLLSFYILFFIEQNFQSFLSQQQRGFCFNFPITTLNRSCFLYSN